MNYTRAETPVNNLRHLQPHIFTYQLLPWLHLAPLPQVHAGLTELCSLVDTFRLALPT